MSWQLEERLAGPDFFKHSIQYATALTHLKARVRDAVLAMGDEQKNRIKEAEKDLNRIPEWKELTGQEQDYMLADLESLSTEVCEDVVGLRNLVSQEYTIQGKLQDCKNRVEKKGRERLQEKLKQEQDKAKKEGQKKITRSLQPKAKITDLNDLDELINRLQQIRGELQYAHEFELTLNIEANKDA